MASLTYQAPVWRPHAATAAAVLVAALAACSGSPGTEPPPGTTPPGGEPAACAFRNPLAGGADPSVARHGGFYYLAQSRDNGIVVYRSDKLTELLLDGGRRTATRVWTAPDTGWNRTHVWAPELQRIGDRWYIYYAAGRAGPPFIHQRSGVLESSGDDPAGPYADRGMLYTGDSVQTRTATSVRWAIDMTVHRLGGQLYAVWSGWERDAITDRTPQHLYAASMSNPYTISSSRAKISSPVAPWERGTELDLQEGPQFLERDGQVFIVYSTRESWLPAYRLGQLRLRAADANPLDSASWVKTGPVFEAGNGIFGPGHNTFTVSPDGSEHWIVYHAKTTNAPGWEDRVIRMQRFTWGADGSPSFGAPVPSSQLVPRPSGECG